MKVVDCFTFFNELDLLELRLEILNPVVDHFVLVEAVKTQTLKDKPLYYEENKARFAKFADKIVHVVVDKCPSNEGNLWSMENFQRNQIKRGLERLGLSGDDIVMISDLDEIPNPDAITQLKGQIDDIHVISFDMEFFAYYFNLISEGKGWVGTVLTKANVLDVIEPQDLRNVKDRTPRVSNAGWHFSWLGGVDKVYEKLHSCIEPFDKSTVPSKEEFIQIFNERVLKEGQFHLINRGDNSVNMGVLRIDDARLPKYLYDNAAKYSHLIL